VGLLLKGKHYIDNKFMKIVFPLPMNNSPALGHIPFTLHDFLYLCG